MKFITALLIAGLLASSAYARISRSPEVTRAFQHEHPCPSTGRPTGACPGYIKDHINPLCAGGPDAVWNMQWQTIADGLAKDRVERRMCRR